MQDFDFAGFQWPRKIARFNRKSFKGKMRRGVCTAYHSSPDPILRGHRPRSVFFYLDSDFMPGLRWQWADEVENVRSIRHTGWFFNDFGDTIRGLVMRLPHGRGFLAGHSMGTHMASRVDATVYDSEREAALAADEMARGAAEAQREYEDEQERIYQEEQDALDDEAYG